MNRNYLKRLDYKKQDIPSAPFNGLRIDGLNKNIDYTSIEEFLGKASKAEIEKVFDYTRGDRQKNCGLGDNFVQEVKEKRNAGVYIKIKKGEATNNLLINFNMSPQNRILYDQNFIHLEEGARAKIFLCFDLDPSKYDCEDGEIFRNGLLTLIAEKNSSVDFIKVQNLPHCAVHFDTTHFYAMENSEVKLYDVQLGGGINGSTTTTFMPEDSANVEIFSLYFADKSRRIDLEQNFIIDGKNSHGNISARGALKNTAYKIFRGNIFLNKGCSKSEARFSDNTIMLDKKTKAACVPTIFCDEDDVIGEHAGSFEAINRAQLYYLMSRGFDELSAKKLIIESIFKPVFNMIDDENLRERLLQEFSESLDDISE